MAPEPCRRCGGRGSLPHGAVVARGERYYEFLCWCVPCPGCQPPPATGDPWLAALDQIRAELERGGER
jgi:hypothetical protein